MELGEILQGLEGAANRQGTWEHDENFEGFEEKGWELEELGALLQNLEDVGDGDEDPRSAVGTCRS